MAYFGLSLPVIARRKKTGNTYTYTDGMELGKSVGTSISPQFAEGSLYANNAEAEHEKRFTKATVDAEVSTVPLKAAEIMFGHTVDAEKRSVVSKTSDKAEYCGYGFVCEEKIDGVSSYTGVWLPCVQFSEGDESLQTIGENITFTTHKVSGIAIGDENGEWREKQTFDAESEAYAFIKNKAGITEASA